MENLGASQRLEINKLAADHPIKRTIRAAVIGWSRKQRGTDEVNGQGEKGPVCDDDLAIQRWRDKSPRH